MINAQSLQQPATQDRILSVLAEADAQSNGPAKRGHAYVENAKGKPMFRIEVIREGGKVAVTCYRGNTDLAPVVSKALGVPLVDLI